MKYFIYIIIALFMYTGCTASAVQQKYRNHTVQKGETVFSISQRYGVSKESIYKLNPDAKKGVQEGSVLVLPTSNNTIPSTESAPATFKMHRVKRKETLFSISQKYNVSQDNLKKYNKDLYSRQLKKGEKIRIPIFSSETVATTTTETSEETTTIKKNTHTVQPKETIYGIARMYGITVAELKEMNTDVPENLPIGTLLNVPEAKVTQNATIDDENYGFYEVKPREGFYRLKVKLGLSQEEIIALNPYAKDGLKDGMIIKIPKASAVIAASEGAEKIDLASMISNRSTKRLAVMLPFQLKRAENGASETNSDLIKKNKSLRVALDFYSGVIMATEFAKDKGISTVLDVYDTEGSADRTRSVISSNNFESTDAVIGPLLRKNVEAAATALKRDDIPVFSPLSNREIKMQSNLFQTLPTEARMREVMLGYLKKYEDGKNFIVIADVELKRNKDAIINAFPIAKSLDLRKDAFLYLQDIEDKIDKEKDNWVILESNNPVLVSNVVALLNGMPEKYGLKLITFDKNDAYEYNDVSNVHLSNLNFTYPSVNKSYNHKDKDAFLVSYKNKYGVLPNRYAVRGFDVTYDVLLRLSVAENIYKSVDSDYVTEYIENKFQYTKKFLSGYQNDAVYIVKYNKDLQFEEVD